jgi:hypothetical protein
VFEEFDDDDDSDDEKYDLYSRDNERILRSIALLILASQLCA